MTRCSSNKSQRGKQRYTSRHSTFLPSPPEVFKIIEDVGFGVENVDDRVDEALPERARAAGPRGL